MCSEKCVIQWINEMFNDLNKVSIKNYDRLPSGKKVVDYTGDYVIVYCDSGKNKVNYIFKDK